MNKPQVLELVMKHFGLLTEPEPPPFSVPVLALPEGCKGMRPF